MIEALARRAYRGTMTMTASAAALAANLPGAPAKWKGLAERLGRLDNVGQATATSGKAFWLHAASVGELVAARGLLRHLRERFPERLYVVTTLTRTGLSLARELPEPHLTFLFPFDAPRPVRRLLDRFRLEAFLFTETEIWPTLLGALRAKGVPTFLVSGRVGDKTIRRARWLRPLYRPALAEVACCMQTEEDARRIVALGADPRRVAVTGSLKFEETTAEPPPEITRLVARLGGLGRRLFVAGSTHAGEDEAVLDAYRRVVPGHAEIVLLLAPRHPERLEAVAAKVAATGLPLTRYSELGAENGDLPSPGVVLLDVVGPLAHCYPLAMAAFVGGSLVAAGGHNVIEPARAGCPVLVGPHTGNTGDTADRLIAGGGALRVSSAESLAWALAGLLNEPRRAADMGRRARVLVESGRGAIERHVKVIAARLTSAAFAESDPESA
ncbi:MAG TPA: glycosyltransferase N-terminal domain-containing protein [Candidatus Binatus sp.]|nr:glycosyltransferase N-terminal domain-containing protein [Candidatus Binatus sp.]